MCNKPFIYIHKDTVDLSLCTPSRYPEDCEAQLHSLLTLTVNGNLHAPADLP